MRYSLLCLLICAMGCAGTREFRPMAARSHPDELQILFPFDSDQVGAEQAAEIRRTVTLLQGHKGLKLILAGHTDSVGDSNYNLELGDRRARSVLVKLVEAGVDPRQLTVVSQGERAPQESNRTQRGRDRNRRVELVVRQ